MPSFPPWQGGWNEVFRRLGESAAQMKNASVESSTIAAPGAKPSQSAITSPITHEPTPNATDSHIILWNLSVS